MAMQSARLSVKQVTLLLLIAFVLELPIFGLCFLFSFHVVHLSAQFVGIVGLVNMAVSLVVVITVLRRWTKVK
jgi:hypothetical protein